jgi:hypothetical protein
MQRGNKATERGRDIIQDENKMQNWVFLVVHKFRYIHVLERVVKFVESKILEFWVELWEGNMQNLVLVYTIQNVLGKLSTSYMCSISYECTRHLFNFWCWWIRFVNIVHDGVEIEDNDAKEVKKVFCCEYIMSVGHISI